MALAQAQIDRVIELVRTRYPNWSSVTAPAFEKDEIAPKRRLAAKAAELLSSDALSALRNGREYDEIVRRLEAVAGAGNMLFLRNPSEGDLAILHDPALDLPSFGEALFNLLHGPGPSPARLDQYLTYIRERELRNRWPFPTYYLFLLHPETDLFVKPRAIRSFLERLGLPGMLPSQPSAGAYAFLLALSQAIRDGLSDFGARDMLDVHSAMWVAGTVDGSVGQPGRPPTTTQVAPPQPVARYWMLAAGEGARLWDYFKTEGIAALGWNYLGDLRGYTDQKAIAEAIMAQRGGEEYPINDSLACYQFANEMREGDAILVKKGLSAFVGYGLVTSDYGHDPSRGEYWNIRKVQWLADGEWVMPEDMQLAGKTLTDITRQSRILNHILPLITGVGPIAQWPIQPPYSLAECARDSGVPEATLATWIEAIERKGQAILYGPPGTGKTWTAKHLARHLVQETDGFHDLVQFHPSYAYEDFIQGIRPESATDGTLRYPLRAGRFLDFCEKASARTGRCVLIVDEINRGNLSRIFGELMFLLEYRDEEIPLAGGNRFRIPSNVRLLGTMNTADRSIALVDHALRRRFAFLQLSPDFTFLARYHEEGDPLVPRLIRVLEEVNALIGDPHYAIGTSYFLTPDLAGSLESIWQMEIEPYLEEQFFDRRERVAQFRWDRVCERLEP